MRYSICVIGRISHVNSLLWGPWIPNRWNRHAIYVYHKVNVSSVWYIYHSWKAELCKYMQQYSLHSFLYISKIGPIQTAIVRKSVLFT